MTTSARRFAAVALDANRAAVTSILMAGSCRSSTSSLFHIEHHPFTTEGYSKRTPILQKTRRRAICCASRTRRIRAGDARWRATPVPSRRLSHTCWIAPTLRNRCHLEGTLRSLDRTPLASRFSLGGAISCHRISARDASHAGSADAGQRSVIRFVFVPCRVEKPQSFDGQRKKSNNRLFSSGVACQD